MCTVSWHLSAVRSATSCFAGQIEPLRVGRPQLESANTEPEAAAVPGRWRQVARSTRVRISSCTVVRNSPNLAVISGGELVLVEEQFEYAEGPLHRGYRTCHRCFPGTSLRTRQQLADISTIVSDHRL